MPEIAPQEAQESTPTSNKEIGRQADEQGLQLNLRNQESTGLDTLLKGLMDPNTQPEPNTPNNQIPPIYVSKDLKPTSKFFNP